MCVGTKRLGRVFAVFAGFFALTLDTTTHAAPQNGRVVEGAGSIERSGTHTDIRQHSDFLATRWDSFNIATHESVQAHQPNSSSRLLIRVDGGGATNIAGSYSSNGITILENQNGVQFSRGAIVNVGGLLATSSRISGADGAHWQLNGTGGAVINNGAIVAGAGGVVLAAVKVQNTGDITSKGGDVMLGAGSSFTVDFAGSMVGFEVSQAASGASLATTGKIESQGGIVSLSAREAQAVRTNVVSVGGVVKATKMERRGGVVYLSGGNEGIAEVSANVSASEKIQTTGEYIVVKEGAVIKAPEILVGGDFQGKGDVPTAQRTLVEAGALLDAGQNGRIIVWADETTWFDGDIIAPEGFAEVSGKKVLASVNLAGIDMGEFGELLLDPEHINITSSSFFINAQVTGDVFANTPVPGGGPTLWLDVASVNRFKGNLSLEANTSLAVGFGAAINKPVGNLTLIAGVDMRISSSINNGANTLTLIAGKRDSVGQILSFSGTHTLTARTLIMNRQGGAFGANGKFRFDVQTLRLNTPANQTVQGWMIGEHRNLILTSTGGTITVARYIDPSLLSGNITLIAAGNLIVNASIYNGTNTLSLTAGTSGAGRIIGSGILSILRLLTARNVILTQADAFDPNAQFTFSANTLTLTTRAAQTVLGWMVADNRNLSLTSNAAITINNHISIGSGKLTLNGKGGIVLGGSIILTASEVELRGAINTSVLGNRNLTITASNFVLLNDDINLGNTGTTSNVLTLRGDTGGVRGVGKPKLTAAAVNLIQNNAFGRNSMFEFSNLIRGLVLTTGAGQTVENWMTAGNRALALNSPGTIRIGGDIYTGSGGLTLNGQDIALFATTSLNGNNIEIIGPINGGNSLFVTASGKITINDDINLTKGVLNLSAGTKIAGVDKPELAANVVVLTQGEQFSSSAPFTFTALSGEAFHGVVVLQLKTAAQQKVHGWMIARGRDLHLTSTEGAILIGSNILTGAGTLTLNGNQGINLTGTAPIALRGANISLAGLLNAENRALSITAASNLTLNGFIVGASNLNLTGNKIVLGGDIALSGVSVRLTGAIDESGTKGNDDLTLRATGRLTLNSHINLGTGVLRIKVGERISVPNSDTNITATAAMIEFSHSGVTDQVIGFTADGIATLGNVNFLATVTYTFLNAAKAGGGVDCELGAGECLLTTQNNAPLTTDDGSLASDVSITIDIGTGALTFGGSAPITITAPVVSITAGTIDIGSRALTITATGGHLTLNANIVGIGSGNVHLISESGNLILGAGVQFTLSTRPLVLTAGGAFDFQSADETPASNIMASTIKLSGPKLPAIMPSAAVITFSPTPSGETNGIIPAWFSNGFDPAAATDCAGQPIICLIQRTNESLKITVTILAPTTSLTINIGNGTLTFAGTGLITMKSPSVSISAEMIDLKGRDLTITADGSALTLNLGGDIANGRVVTIGAVNKGLAFSIASARALAAESILFLSNGPIAVGAALSLNARGTLTLSSGLTGNGDLALGTGSAAVIRLIAAVPIDILAHGTLAVNGAMLTNLMANGVASGLSGVALRAAGDRGRVELNSDIDIRLLDGQTAGELTIISSGTVVLGGAARTIAHAGAITLTGSLTTAANTALTMTAAGDITLNSNINLGSGALVLTAGQDAGTGDIMNGGGARTLTASTVSLRQDSTFAADLLVIASDDLTLRTAAAQTVHDWMVASGRTLSLTASGDITIGGDVDAGGGDLTFDGTAIVLGAGLTLTGGAVELTGEIAGTNALTIDASGDITLNDNIATGGAGLTLDSATAINLGAGVTSLTGGSVVVGAISRVSGTASLTITASRRLSIFGNINIGAGALVLSGTNIFLRGGGGARSLMGSSVELTGHLDSRVEGDGASANNIIIRAASSDITINGDITATGSDGVGEAQPGGRGGDLTLTATSGNITINGEVRANGGAGGDSTDGSQSGDGGDGGVIIIEGVRVLADLINSRGRSAGAFNSGSSGSAGADGRIMITATGGDLTLRGNMDVDGGQIHLTVQGTGAILNDGTTFQVIRLTAGEINLTQMGAFAADDLLAFPRDRGDNILTLRTSAAQIVHSWMIGDEFSLVLISTKAITLAQDFTTNRDITLNGSAIVLMGSRSLTGRTITLTGAVDESENLTHDNLTLTASRSLNLMSDINVGSGTLILIAGEGGTGHLMPRAITLTASTLSLTQDPLFGANAPYTLAAGIEQLNLTTNKTAAQTLKGWMLVEDRSLSLTAAGQITIGVNVDIGNGNLALSGASIMVSGGGVIAANQIMIDGNLSSAVALTLTARANAAGALTFGANTAEVSAAGQDLTLTANGGGAASIVFGANTLTLSAANIGLNGAMNASANDYNLTITASGDITLNSGINLDTGTLTLTAGMGGTGNIADGAGMPTLTASTVSLTQDDAFGGTALFTFATPTLELETAAAQMVESWMFAVSGRTLSLTSTAAITIGRDIATGGGNLTLNGGTLTLSGGARTLSGADIELTGALTAPGLALIITAAGDITINDNISLGAGALTLTAGTDGTGNILSDADIETLTASTVSFMQAGAFGDTALFTFATPTLELETAAAQTVYDWMDDAGRDLSLTSTAAITIGRDIATGGGNLTLNGGTLTLSGGALTLSGADIELIGALTAPGFALIITAAGDITINDNISLGAGALTLTAGTDGTGNILSDADIETLTASTVSFMQAGAFGDTALFTFATPTLELETAAAQTVHNWMAADGRNLSLTSTGGGAITIGADITIGAGSLTLSGTALTLTGGARILSGANISLTGATANAAALTLTAATKLTLNGNIDVGAGNLTLNLGSAVADLSGSLELSGSVVTITGERGIMAAGDLTISALGNLAVNTDINVGMNTLRLLAGRADGNSAGETGDIVFMPNTLVLQAANFELTQDGALFPNTRPAVFRDEDGMGIPTQGNPENIHAIYDGDLNQQNVPWARFLTPSSLLFDQVDSAGNLVIMPGPYLRNGVIEASVDIVINAGAAGIVTFAAGIPSDLTLMANEITITAEAINIGEHRTLTITAEGGTLMLNVGAITAGELSLSAATIEGLSSSLALNVPTVSLELTGAGSFTAQPFVTDSTIATLNITTRAPQSYHSWMAPPAGSGRNLSINTMGVLTLPSASINLGAGNLTLNGATITFTNPAGLRITAGEVSLTGAINQAASNLALRVMATGDITLNSNINTGTGLLRLSTTGSIGNGGAARTIMSSALYLRHSGAFGADLLAPASRASGRVNLRVWTALAQPIHPWMVSLGEGDFSLHGAGGAVLTSITTTAALERTGTITLRASMITLGAALTGAAVTLHADTIAGDGNNLVAIHATARDITAMDIAGTGRPALATSVTGLSLTRSSAFWARITLPFTFVSANITAAVTLSTRSAQTYRGWMTLSGRTVILTTTDALTIPLADINVGTGDLTLSADGGITFTNAAGLTLTATDVSLTGAVSSTNRQLTMAATGGIALNGSIATGTGNITLTAPGATGITLGGNVVLRGNAVNLDGVVNGATGNHGLRIDADDNITLGGSIDLGMGKLNLRAGNDGTGNIFSSGDAREIMSGDLRLRQAGAFTDTLFTTGSRASSRVNLRVWTAVDQMVHPWMAGLGNGDFSLHGPSGAVMTSITTTAALTRSAGTITLHANTITLGAALTGTAVSLRADTIAGDGNNLAAIHATAGDITATGADGIGRPVLDGGVRAFSLTQNSAFERVTLPFTFVGADITEAITLSTRSAQTYRGWMRGNSTTANLTVMSTGVITITRDVIIMGTGDLTLSADGGITFTNAAGLTIRAGEVALTGEISAANLSLTIMAQANILAGSINLGTGRLDLQAGLPGGAANAITFADGSTIAARRVSLAQGEQFVAASNKNGLAETFVLPTGIRPEGVFFSQTTPPTTQSWIDIRLFSEGDFVIDTPGMAINIPTSMNSLNSITLNAGDAALTFDDPGGSNAPITLIAPIVTITAGSIDFAGRALTIIATNGALTLNVGATITSTASLFLRGDTIVGLGSDITFDVPTLGLTLTGAERSFDVPPFEAASRIGTLNITTRAPLTYRGWMAPDAESNRNLILLSTTGALTFTLASINLGAGNLTLTSAVGADITFTDPAGLTLTVGNLTLFSAVSSANLPLIVAASGAITLNSDINTGTGGLALSGASIVLGGDVVRLTSGAVSLTGAINEMANNRTLRVIAAGNITLNSNINLGTGVLSLTTTGSIGNGGAAPGELPELTASTVSLRQAEEFAAIAMFGFTDTSSLTLSRTGGHQTIHPWMQTALTGGSLTITAPGTLLMRGVGFDFGANNLTLTSEGIVRIGANITTTGNIILTGVASSTRPAIRFENGAREVRGGNITLNGSAGVLTSTTEPARNGGSVTLTAASGILILNSGIDTGTNNLTLTGATIQIARAAGMPADTRILLSGQNITLTSANGIEIGRIIRRGVFLMNKSVANFIVTADGTLTIAANITVASTTTTGGDIELTGGSIDFGAAARTITGRAITLIGAARGTADLTLTASGILKIKNNITLTGAGSLTLISTGGAVRILDNITTTGNITLSGGTNGINFNNGAGAKTFSGAIITLTGVVVSNRDLTITASGTLTINNDITLTGSGLTLALSGAGAIVGTADRPRLTASTVSLTQIDAFAADERGKGLFKFRAGSLVLTTRAAQDVHNWMISAGRNLTLTSPARVRMAIAIGASEPGRDLGTGSLTLVSTGADIRIEADITTTGNITLNGATGIDLSGDALTISGAAITLTGVAMSDANLTINASGILTINDNITLTGTSILDLSGAGAISDGGTPTVLIASTVRLAQVAAFAEDALFTFGSATGSLEFTTAANQDVHDWMIEPDRNLTVESTRRVSVLAEIVASGGGGGARDLGTGALTLTSTGGVVRILANITTGGAITLTSTGGVVRIFANLTTGGDITLDGATGIDTSGGARAFSGEGITLNGAVVSDRALTITTTTDALRVENNITLTGTSNLTLSSATVVRIFADISTGGDITLSGGTIGINFNNRGAKTLSGAAIMLTGAAVSNRDLTLTASGTLTLNSNIIATGTSALSLSGSSGITLDGALTLTGGDITLTGAATGSANLTLTARGTLTLNNDITLTGDGLTLALSGAGAIVATGRPRLTASTVSFRQDAAFAAIRPFRFGAATGSLEFTTIMNQDAHNWMIVPDTNLTVTSSNRVRVLAAIGEDERGRNLGTGDITLTSTGGAVRILANISTGGDLTLNGTSGINLNGRVVGVRTLAGAIVTLTGNAWSNRDLTLTASGVLTINNNIDIGTGTLTLTATDLADTSVDLAAGDHIFDPIRPCDGSTTPSCTTNTP